MRVSAYILAFSLLAVGCEGQKNPLPPGAVTAPARAEPVSGLVTYAGEPVAKAFLVVTALSTGEVPGVDVEQLFTDADGRFALDLPVDDYELQAVGPEGRTARLLTNGQRTELSLALCDDESAALRMLEPR